MSFIEEIKTRAKENIKTIILPEADDIRILEATQKINKEGFAKIILIGNDKEILKKAKENNLDISGAKIINPSSSEDYDNYVNLLYELRKNKGMTEEKAKELVLNPVYYGMLMVKEGKADGLVSGAAHSTSDTLRPALQILKTAPNTKLVSAFFVMVVPNCELGENGVFIFGDSGLNENPDMDQLSEIAISSAKSFRQLVEKEPKVAMLSYSTHGSAHSELTEKVIGATKLVKEKDKDLLVDGELQLDVQMEKIKIQTEYIKLDQFLKWTGTAESGVDAKDMILAGEVKVNGEVEERRGKKLRAGDIVEAAGKTYQVE